MPMILSIQIAKFKFHKYQMRSILPNLMLAKVTLIWYLFMQAIIDIVAEIGNKS